MAPLPVLDEVQRILQELGEIPTVPGALVRLWALVDDPTTNAEDLERAVSVEPPLAAKVLRLANSSYFGGRGRVHSLHDAISVLGVQTLRQVAVGLSVAASVEPAGDDEHLRSRELWRHCVATGVLSRALARDLGSGAPEEAFTAGLLHDVGMGIIAMRRPGAYRAVADLMRRDGLDLIEAEQRVLGFDHALVGEVLARSWGFPRALGKLIRHHHDGDFSTAPPAWRILALADRLCHEWFDDAMLGELRLAEPAARLSGALGVDAAWLGERRDQYVAEIASAGELVALV